MCESFLFYYNVKSLREKVKATLLEKLHSLFVTTLNQHDGNAIFHRIDRAALLAAQGFLFRSIIEVALARWAAEDIEKFFVKHDLRLGLFYGFQFFFQCL